MSGHSKWSTIKRKKAAADQKRGNLFTKLVREITIAAKTGGGDPDGNPRLRLAIDTAKMNSMPQENIQRAIKKGTGELEGVNYEEITYEGYGPGGIAILIETATDNRNRTVADIRHSMNRHNGSLGESGSVSWMFQRKGSIEVLKASVTEEQLFELLLDAGLEDLDSEDEHYFKIITAVKDLEAAKKALELAGVSYENAKIDMIPENLVELADAEAQKAITLLDALENCDDVQAVFSNLDVSEQTLNSLDS